MCIRRSDSVLFPLVVIVVMLAAVASAFDDRADDSERPQGSLLQRLSNSFSSSFQRSAEKAPLDEGFEPHGKLVYIDLSESVNKKLADGTIQVDGNTLEEVKPGEQELAGIKFNVIDGVMQLTSEGRERFPKSIDGISVDDSFERLYVFHSTQGSGNLADGTLIGKYVVHYEDEKTQEIPIRVGEDVRDWWNVDGSRKVTKGRVGWVGMNPGVRRFGHSLRLYVTEWENPRPDKKVTAIDYVSESVSQAGPFCLAMTIETAAPEQVADGDAAESEVDSASTESDSTAAADDNKDTGDA